MPQGRPGASAEAGTRWAPVQLPYLLRGVQHVRQAARQHTLAGGSPSGVAVHLPTLLCTLCASPQDWKHLGGGAWEPKTRGGGVMRRGGRGGKRKRGERRGSEGERSAAQRGQQGRQERGFWAGRLLPALAAWRAGVCAADSRAAGTARSAQLASCSAPSHFLMALAVPPGTLPCRRGALVRGRRRALA